MEINTPHNATIRWGDGYAIVEPSFPPELLKRLKYWRRSFEWDEAAMRRVSSGRYEALYTIKSWLDESSQQFHQQLVTLPGFVFLIRKTLQECGYTVTIQDERTPIPKPDLFRAMEGLRDYQIPIVYTALMSGGGIVSAPTGVGKTHVMGAIARAYAHADLQARNTPLTVMACPDKDITAKNYNDFVRMLPDRDVGLVMSGHSKFSDDIQVITLDSLHRIDPLDVGLLIVDEVHTAASDSRAEDLNKITKALRWGVSATPTGRFDGKDLCTTGIFGPIVHTMTYQQGVDAGALVPIKVFWIKCPEPEMGLEKLLRFSSREGRYRHGVLRNKPRNQLIANILKDTADVHQTLVIMQFLEQMNRIAELTDSRTKLVHAETDQAKLDKDGLKFVRAIKTAERREIYRQMEAEEIHQILSTHVYKQGVNFPNLEVVIVAGGGGSDIVAHQIPGRASRKTAEKEVSYLVDFWHPWDTQRKNERMGNGPIHADDVSREKAYKHLGFNQTWIDDYKQLPFITKETT